MLKIKQYVKAETLEQAYQLNQKKNNVILGGMLWLKMQERTIDTAIDLSGLGLDYIREENNCIQIGAMTSLREVENNPIMSKCFNGSIKEAFKHIVGVQFRNCATIGGSVFGRFGFSDVLTIFMALDAQVRLYNKGIVSLKDFAAMKPDRDILVEIIVPVRGQRAVYNSVRNTHSDFPVLTCAVVKDEGWYRVAIGARPDKAVLFTGCNEEELINKIDKDIVTHSNYRASDRYRHSLATVLTRRGIVQIGEIGCC